MKIKIYITIILAALLCSCNRIDETVENYTTGEEISVPVTLLIGNVHGTKAVNDPTNITSAENVIKNLWIVQYNGTSNESEVMGKATYIEDFSQWDGNVTLLSTSAASTIYFIANTFEGNGEFPVYKGCKLADLKNHKRAVHKEQDILGIEDSDKQHVMFCGNTIIEKLDGTGDKISCTLQRNIAKATIQIINEGEEDKVKILSAQICSVPSASSYITDYISGNEEFPPVGSFKKVNYEPVNFSAESQTVSFTTYLPVNQRGTTLSGNQKEKNKFAPDGSTYLLITATYGENEYPITYTFYLGENLKNDHNLKANTSYEYKFTIEGKGDAETDSRVYNWGLVDFTDETEYQLSNCYILNPMPSGKLMRSFRIPIKRAIEYWGSSTTKNYEDSYNNALRDNAQWRCFILASDFEINESNFQITTKTGKSNDNPYFEVKVAPGVEGNVIIAIGHTKDDHYSVSWSWHLWITDYQPDQALEMGKGTTGTYIYAVPNGSVHRYAGQYWNNNPTAYIMDRNLGSFNSSTYPLDDKGLLYYQYGRKDPFFIKKEKYKYTNEHSHTFNTVERKAIDNSDTRNSVAYSVNNPLHFIMDELTWVNNENYTNSSYIWNDKLTAGKNKKSIFDPCPPGYRVPDKSVWSDWKAQGTKNADKDIIYNTASKITTNIFDGNSGQITAQTDYLRGFKSYVQIKGEQYWPTAADTEKIPDNVIYYPAQGLIRPNTGKIDNHGNSTTEYWQFVWAEDASVDDSTKAFSHTSQPDYFTGSSTKHQKARGFAVRCIRDLTWVKGS